MGSRKSIEDHTFISGLSICGIQHVKNDLQICWMIICLSEIGTGHGIATRAVAPPSHTNYQERRRVDRPSREIVQKFALNAPPPLTAGSVVKKYRSQVSGCREFGSYRASILT